MKFPRISADTFKLSPAAGLKGVKDLVGTGSPRVSGIGAVVGAGIDSISATRDERAFLSELVDEYRPEVAKRLGLSEKQVTAEHFNAAFKENPVLAQAKQLTAMNKAVRLTSNAVSVVAGVVAGMGASIMVRRGQKTEGMQENAADIAGALAATFGGMSAGKVTRRLLHMRGREGILEDTAHGRIMVIKNKQQLGEPTDAADIFQVQLAVNPQVGEAIAKNFGKPFAELGKEEQLSLLQNEFPEILEANNEMARRINEGARPQGLLFADVEDVKAKDAQKKEGVYAELREDKAQEEGQVALTESSPAATSLPVPQEQVKQFGAEPEAQPSGVVVPDSQKPLEQVPAPVTVDTAQGISPEAQKRLIRSIEEYTAQPELPQAATAESVDEARQVDYSKEEHEAVHAALKAALSRKPAASHAEGVEREREQVGEAAQAR